MLRQYVKVHVCTGFMDSKKKQMSGFLTKLASMMLSLEAVLCLKTVLRHIFDVLVFVLVLTSLS